MTNNWRFIFRFNIISSLFILFSESAFSQSEEGGLDFGALGESKEAATQYIVAPATGEALFWTYLILFILTLSLIAFMANFLHGRRGEVAQSEVLKIVSFPRPRTWPISLQVLITGLLIGYLLVMVFAFLNIYVQTNVAAKNVEEYFFYKSVPKLLGMTHAHLFGLSTLFVFTGILFSFVEIKKVWLKTLIPVSGLFAAIFDIGSWWGIKYITPTFEYFSQLSGIIFFISYAAMSLFLINEFYGDLLLKKRGNQ